MNPNSLKYAAVALARYYPNADKTERIIIECAVAAVGADMLGAAFPVLAIPATIASCFGAVWVMYGRLAATLGISLKEKTLKLLARAALSNIAANLGGLLLTFAAGMLIPGASVVSSALVTYGTVYVAGVVFLRMIEKLAESSADPATLSDISEKDMKKAVSETELGKEHLEAAKASFKINVSKE